MRKVFIVPFVIFAGLFLELRADSKPNPRGGVATAKTASAAQALTGRGVAEAETREQTAENFRANRTTKNRGVIVSDRVGARAAPARGAVAAAQPVVSRAATARAAQPVIGSAATRKTSVAARSAVRSATISAIANGVKQPAGRARAAAPQSARATALFTNMSAMGSEYNQCREAYFACMDQFCGLKSDTYRRCLCSDKFRDFKDREDAFDQAKQMITQFNDNNLNAIGLSGAEVNSMYSASEGEAALRKDTSASAKMLENINSLLSGKTKASTVATKSAASRTLSLDLDFDSGSDDIWGGGGGGGGNPFSGGRSNAVNVESLEGAELYEAVRKQCMEVSSSCGSNQASSNMVTSAYTVLIAQDCSTYEKKLDAQKSALEATIREANNAMRDARLEDFRSHNSADVNECMDKVIAGMKAANACGPNWEKCLDFTGQYINSTDGEPLFTPLLVGLKDVINLYNQSDQANQTFLEGLRKKKMFVSAPLDSCRGIADAVWTAFEEAALIEIAQAQDRKIAQVQDTCVSMIKDCYDSQTGQAKDFGKVKDDEEMSSAVQSATAALGQRFAKSACKDKVSACASLYAKPGDPPCSFDDKGALLNGGQCGMQALLTLVNTVDDTKITMSCKRDLQDYITTTCTPGDGSGSGSGSSSGSGSATATTSAATGCVSTENPGGTCTPLEQSAYEAMFAAKSLSQLTSMYPYKCRHKPLMGKGSIYELLTARAKTVCLDSEKQTGDNQTVGDLLDESQKQAIREIMEELERSMGSIMQKVCEEHSDGTGMWISNWDAGDVTVVPAWAVQVFDSQENYLKTVPSGVRVTFGDASNATVGTVLEAKPGLAAAGTNANIIVPDDGAARGWGVCRLAADKLLCEWVNDVVGANIATYDTAGRMCNYESGYSKSVCANVLNGVWDANANTCQYVPM